MKEKPNRIAELRRKNGISQEKLAEILNVSQASVSLYENGNNIPTDILVAIARYFGVTMEYLLKVGGEPDNTVSKSEHDLLCMYRNLLPKHRKIADKIIGIIMGAEK